MMKDCREISRTNQILAVQIRQEGKSVHSEILILFRIRKNLHINGKDVKIEIK